MCFGFDNGTCQGLHGLLQCQREAEGQGVCGSIDVRKYRGRCNCFYIFDVFSLAANLDKSLDVNGRTPYSNWPNRKEFIGSNNSKVQKNQARLDLRV